MKNSLLISLTTAALALPVAAYAVDPGNIATGNVSAEVISPLTITPGDQMSFGSFSPSSSAGLVYTDGTPPTGNITPLTPGGPGNFDVAGNQSSTYTITVPATTTITDGTHNMTVDLAAPAGGTLDSETGTDNFDVNGTLHVNANQAPGSYDGTYNVTVDY